MVSLFGGKDTPTAGFALGFDRTIVALESENYKFEKNKLDAYVIPLDKNFIEKALEIVQLLRKNGISADLDLLKRGFSKSLKYASSINAKYAILIGEDEIKQNSVTIKELDTGKQILVEYGKIFELLK